MERKIITTYFAAPIPIRSFDWQAVREGYDEGDLIGEGKTERESINNLLDKEEDEYCD